MFGLGAIVQVGLVLAGCWWCKEILGLFRSDVVELRSGDWTARSAILLIWAETGAVLYLICSFVLHAITFAGEPTALAR